MGQNSTEIAYGFGQMGSVFTNLAAPVYPPKDHVIIAIQCLAEATFSVLETETLDTMGPQFLTHQDDELATAGGPDANYLGVVQAAISGTGGIDGSVDITDVVDNLRIKVGQYVLIGADGDDIDTGLDDMAGINVDPIYQGPNQQGIIVKKAPAAGTYGRNLQLSNADGSTLDASSLGTSNTLYFLDEYHGAGGTTIEGVTFPKGITIYGRWTKVTPGADADGGIICYFGK